MKRMKQVFSILLCCAVVVGYIPAPVLAEETDQRGLCEHHPEHIDCGYTPAVEADVVCCDYVCAECSVQAEETTCNETLNYAAVPSLAAENSGEEPSEPMCICETACGGNNGIHLDCAVCLQDFANCIQYEPVCTCAEKCTGEMLNTWCAICAEEGAESCTGKLVGACYVASGVYNAADNIGWTLDADGTLTIIGEGQVDGEPQDSYNEYLESIKVLKFAEGITSIYEFSFVSCPIPAVIFPESLREIGMGAFRGSDFTKVVIPAGVTSIGQWAFENCTDLEEVEILSPVTEIGLEAFHTCYSLRSLKVAEENTRYTTVDNVLFTEDMRELIQFAPGNSILHYTVPEGVVKLEQSAFYDASELESLVLPESLQIIGERAFVHVGGFIPEIVIPKNVTAIGYWAFFNSYMDSLRFEGDAPTFGKDVFYYTTVTVYYPADNDTWTEEVMQNYGGTVTWVPYESDESGEDAPAGALEDLQPIDYLAFSHIAYLDWHPIDHGNPKTVKEILVQKGKWDAPMEAGKTDIKYSELCANIASWYPCSYKEDSSNGFYGVAFRNNDNEIVLAYRGSASLTSLLYSQDAQGDWLKNDLPTIIFDNVDRQNQFMDACMLYGAVNLEYKPSGIVVTGHSLGGGLADLVSARYGCRAESMNAISVLDAYYYQFPAYMGENFRGVDRWKIRDHANGSDIAAGVYESVFADVRIKPYIAYQNKAHAGDPFAPHSMYSYIQRTADGRITMTDRIGTFEPDTIISEKLNSKLGEYLVLGTGSSDKMHSGLVLPVVNQMRIYGGDGRDEITTSYASDILIGGNDVDIQDAGWGNDTYVYHKGHGSDIIYDVHGDDKLWLIGFSAEDTITYYVDDNDSAYIDDYIYIQCNGETIVSINKSCRAYSVYSSNSFKIYVDGELIHDISESFKNKLFKSRTEIACPVSVEILDAEGNVVYTLQDGVAGNFYTEYGNFYVYEEGNGQYGKILDLVEGYTYRIVGQDTGTMEIEYRDITDGTVSETPVIFTEVPVSEQFTATFEETADGNMVLNADVDGDNVIDTAILPASIAIAEESVELAVGESVQLTADIQPESLAQDVRWTTDNEKVITVDETGVVTAVGVGEANVIATISSENILLTAKCHVVVSDCKEEIELIDFYAANVIMGNNLDMMFALRKTAVSDWTGHYIQIERIYADGRAAHIQKIPYAQWDTNGSFYVVTYKGLAAKEMCDTITLTVYNAEDRAVSRPWVDSMRSYAMRQLTKCTDLQKTMFVDMLNYGAQAQSYFGYGTEDLANSQLTAEQKACASGAKTLVSTLDQGDQWKASNLILKSNIQFMVAFNGLTDDMSARVQFTGHKGNVVDRTVSGTEFGNNNGIRYVLIDDLVIADARQEITITIYNADGSVYTVCQESIQDYLARRSSVSSLFEAIMKFADSAYAYLHRND